MAVASVGHRLSTAKWVEPERTEGVQHPAHAEDAAAAFAWLREQANKFGYDPERIFIGGYSCGAYLAAALQPATATLLAVTVGSFLGLFTVVAYVGPMVTRGTGFEGSSIGAVQIFVGLGAVAGIALGGRAAWGGAALSASAPDLPTGPLIVLVSFAVFVASMLLAPSRGLVSTYLRHRRFQRGVHIRQGLLSLAQGLPIYEPLTLRLLKAEGLARPDGVPTDSGKARAARAHWDEKRWEIARSVPEFELAAARYDGLTQLDDVLTPDQIADIDARIAPPEVVT